MNTGGARDPEGGARDPRGGARDPQGGARDPDEAQVARLLAEAGADPLPMPAEVSARLDDVLADLQRQRATAAPASGADDVVELRARRRWPRLLLAAAAVVVGGYGVGTVLTQGTLSGTDSDMSAGSEAAVMDESGGGTALRRDADRQNEADRGGDAEASGEGGAPLESAPESTRTQGSFLHLGRPVTVRSDELETGVRRALRLLDRGLPATADLSTDALKQASQRCPAPSTDRRERSLLVRYDGARAVLVAGPEQKGPVEVTIYSCSGTELVATLVRR